MSIAQLSLFERLRYPALPPVECKNDDAEREMGIEIWSKFHQRKSQSDFNRIAAWSLLICFLCTLINTAVCLLKPSSPSYETTITSITRADMAKLRRPNQFIGFDKIKRPFPPEPKATVNYPMVLAIVDSENATRVLSDDPKRQLTWRGMISPEERKVEVSKSVSTIVQFRAVDWGFEACSLTIKIPPESIAYLPPAKYVINSSLFLGSNHNPFDIYRFDASDMFLDPKSLTYDTRPKVLGKVATVSADFGMDWNWSFPCAKESLHAFELRAVNELTRFEWWQDKEVEYPVIYLEQRATA